MMIDPTRVDAVEAHISEVVAVLRSVTTDAVHLAISEITRVQQLGKRVYVLGNGGSATTATHFACDLCKATIVDGSQRLRVISLTDNTALLTAWANDTTYERVFVEQLLSLVVPHDLVVAFSVSGSSPNVVAAMAAARELGARTLAFLGLRSPGSLLRCTDVAIHIACDDFRVVEDCHLALAHAITAGTRQLMLRRART